MSHDSAVGGKRKQLDDDVDMVDKNKTLKPQFPAISPGKLTVRFQLSPLYAVHLTPFSARKA